MTEAQERKVSIYFGQFRENKEEYLQYDSESICDFKIYENKGNESDKSITIVNVAITGLSDSFQPYTKKTYLLITENGSVVNLADSYNEDEIDNYMAKLKLI